MCLPSRSHLILHPQRLRLLQTLAGRQLTASALGEALSDVPQATLYRHLKALVEGEVLEIVAERPVRGTVERVYALREGGGFLTKEDFAAMDLEEHRRSFRVFVASVLGNYERYLERPGAQPAEDGVGYSTGVLELSPEEQIEFRTRFRELMAEFQNRKSSPERERFWFSVVFMPAVASTLDPTAGEAPDEGPAERTRE
jgi:DNA-binding transcriptional ArsR family regulator